jgi:alanyl-tRNA synthetase
VAASPAEVFGVQVVTHDAGTVSADDLRSLALDVRGRLTTDRPAVVAMAGVAKERPVVVVAINEEGRRWGLSAADLVRQAATILGGGGGGSPEVAQGGGSDPARIGEALHRVEHVVGEVVTADR